MLFCLGKIRFKYLEPRHFSPAPRRPTRTRNAPAPLPKKTGTTSSNCGTRWTPTATITQSPTVSPREAGVGLRRHPANSTEAVKVSTTTSARWPAHPGGCVAWSTRLLCLGRSKDIFTAVLFWIGPTSGVELLQRSIVSPGLTSQVMLYVCVIHEVVLVRTHNKLLPCVPDVLTATG